MKETSFRHASLFRKFTFCFIHIFTAAYAYQIVYLLIGFFGKGKGGKQAPALHRYAAIIAARNEENVIGDLIKSLKRQDYPAELLDVIVIADNCCTDRTAEVSRQCGRDRLRAV